MWRSAPESSSFTWLVSQPPSRNPMSDRSSSDQPAAPGPLLAGSEPSLQALREQVLRAAASSRRRRPATTSRRSRAGARGGVTLERPPRAEFGDYSTNAALLLAPRLGQPPREVAERLGAGCRRRSASALRALRGRGPRLPQPVPRRRLAARRARRRARRRRALRRARAPRAAQRINVEFVSANPTGPMHVGHARNAAYGDALARHARVPRPRRRARVLRQRRRQPGASSFGESVARAGARAAGRPRTATSGDYVAELAARLPGRGERRRAPSSAVQAVAADGRERSSARSTRSACASFDHWTYESALHDGIAERRSSARSRCLRASSAHSYAQRRRAVAAHDRVRRRQGPRAGALERRAHLLRVGHRLPQEQARARLRAPDRRVGRRPPRLRARMKAAYAALGGDPDELELVIMQLVHLVRSRRARADVQARRRVRHARRARRRDRRRRRALVPARALARHDRRPRPRPRARASRARTPSTTSSTRTRGSPRCSRRPGGSASTRRSPSARRPSASTTRPRPTCRCTPPSAR